MDFAVACKKIIISDLFPLIVSITMLNFSMNYSNGFHIYWLWFLFSLPERWRRTKTRHKSINYLVSKKLQSTCFSCWLEKKGMCLEWQSSWWEGDVVGAGYVEDNAGKIVGEDKLLKVWIANYDKLSNEEFAWDREGLTNVSPVCGE